MSAWKDLERRICAALGGRRAGPIGAAVSDCVNTPFAVEIKRCKSQSVQTRFIEQARAQGAREGKPSIVVVAGHNDRRPTVTLDFQVFLEILHHAPLFIDDDKEPTR